MNKQYNAKTGGRGIEWTDYTWNPIGGCFHACQWEMPDGKIANCYAEDVAEGVAMSAYPEGFEHHYWNSNILRDPGRQPKPSKIFVGSMADVFGHWVEEWQIGQVLDVARACPWHTFQFLTKNPKRAQQFSFPDNCWVGISAPPTHMWNKKLTHKQQWQWLVSSLHALRDVKAKVKWMSIEPLSHDIGDSLILFGDFLDWIVVGAASNGKKVYQPDPLWVENVLGFASSTSRGEIPVFFKGNLHGNIAANPWREEFPITGVTA